jgi:Holliday junction DNA helicase RuvB
MAIVSSHTPDDSAKPKGAKPKPSPPPAEDAALQPLLSLVKGGEVQPEDLGDAATAPAPAATAPEDSLRPQRLQDYIGQASLKEVLGIAIQAAQSRQEPLDHLLLYGPPGWAKPPWR